MILVANDPGSQFIVTASLGGGHAPERSDFPTP
jgi:hypothetical protein